MPTTFGLGLLSRLQSLASVNTFTHNMTGNEPIARERTHEAVLKDNMRASLAYPGQNLNN